MFSLWKENRVTWSQLQQLPIIGRPYFDPSITVTTAISSMEFVIHRAWAVADMRLSWKSSVNRCDRSIICSKNRYQVLIFAFRGQMHLLDRRSANSCIARVSKQVLKDERWSRSNFLHLFAGPTSISIIVNPPSRTEISTPFANLILYLSVLSNLGLNSLWLSCALKGHLRTYRQDSIYGAWIDILRGYP